MAKKNIRLYLEKKNVIIFGMNKIDLDVLAGSSLQVYVPTRPYHTIFYVPYFS